MVTYNDIEEAHQRISDHIHNTPILTSDSLDNELGSNLFFKCENFQKTGSFKILSCPILEAASTGIPSFAYDMLVFLRITFQIFLFELAR